MKKKLFVGVLAVGIALMLVAMPYENNAFVIPLLIGVGVGVGLGYLLNNYFSHKNTQYANNNIQYTYNATQIKQEWDNKFQEIKNNIIWANSTAWNLIEAYKNMDLVYTRYAERKALEHLDKNNWSEVSPYIFDMLDNDIKQLYENVLLQFSPPLNELASEIEHIGYISSLGSNDDIIAYARYTTSSGATQKVNLVKDNNIPNVLMSFVAIGNIGAGSYDSFKNKLMNESRWYYNNTNFAFYSVNNFNETNVSTILDEPVDFAFLSDSVGFYTEDLTRGTRNGDNWLAPSWTGQYAFKDFMVEIKLNGDDKFSYLVIVDNINLQDIRDAIKNMYNSIKMTADNNAYALWKHYKDLGYNNISQLPSDEIPVFPDNLLDNAEALSNLSYNDGYLAYLTYLQQLANNPNLLNLSSIDWNDLSMANYSGKVINITLIWANSTNYKTIFSHEKCYILPLENSLSLSVEKAYYVGNESISNAVLNNMKTALNISSLNMINQQLYIYAIDLHKIYYIKPTNEYAFYVHGLTVNNVSVNSTALDIQKMGKLLFPNLYYDNNLPYPTFNPNSNGNWLNWIIHYKGLLTIGLIVLGILFTASTRKSDGLHSLGIIMLLLGIGMAFYFYLLPAWHGISNFAHNLNPLNWFKR